MSNTISRTAGGGRGRALLPDRLVSGYEAFLGERFPYEQERFHHLAEAGQNPRIMLIGCCDSRVSPEVGARIRGHGFGSRTYCAHGTRELRRCTSFRAQ
jgi:hypothetical protein